MRKRVFAQLLVAFTAGAFTNALPEPLPTPTYATPLTLHRRQECPAGTFHCPASLGEEFSDVCCANGQKCDRDERNQPACCPAKYGYAN